MVSYTKRHREKIYLYKYMEIQYIILAFIITLVTIPLIVYFATKKRLLSRPNNRSSHSTPITALGGIAIYLGFIIPNLFLHHVDTFQFTLIFICSTIIFGLGLIDDIIDIRAYKKLIIIIVFSIVISSIDQLTISNLHGLFNIYYIPKYIGIPLTTLVVIVIINSINLVDGIDGLASSLSIINLSYYSYIFYLAGKIHYLNSNLIIIASLLAFLSYNLYGKRFKIFMGDSGSLLIGLLLSISILHFINLEGEIIENSCSIYVSTIFALLVVPLYDIMHVCIRRMTLGLKIFIPDKRHIHHTFLKLGFTHKHTSVILVNYTLVFFLISEILNRHTRCWIAMVIILILAKIAWGIPEHILKKNLRKYAIKEAIKRDLNGEK